MSATQNLAPLYKACTDIANQIADSDGFVSIRRLLERFRTNLRMRPLLVEGMIGSTHSVEGQTPQWTILIDSERYPHVASSIDGESTASPLTARFRFTVAHELAHSLAFRTGEFGVKLDGFSGRSESRSTLVQEIEREADHLAPLLLCAEQVLTDRLCQLTEPIDLTFITKLQRDCGISYEVLLNRLALSRAMDRSGLWQRPHLREFGVVIGEWNSPSEANFRRWPSFLNFSRLLPKGILNVTQQDKVPFEVAFGPGSLALVTKGTHLHLTTPAGTGATPDVAQMSIEIVAEHVNPVPGSLFLVLVRNSQIRAEVEEFEKIRRSTRIRRQLPTS
jgi:hypothetical protein